MSCLRNDQIFRVALSPDPRYLNDEVINFYIAMLNERGLPNFYMHSTFFYSKLARNGDYNYKPVKKWCRKVDLTNVRTLCVPHHIGMHWTLTYVDIVNRTVTYYDSLGDNGGEYIAHVIKYMTDKFMIDAKEWTKVPRGGGPQQENRVDCGVFVLKTADYISRGMTLDFTQVDIPNFRNELCFEIANGRFL